MRMQTIAPVAVLCGLCVGVWQGCSGGDHSADMNSADNNSDVSNPDSSKSDGSKSDGSKSDSSGSLSNGLIGHWKLTGDCRDHSGNGNHGVNHGVNLQTSSFDGRGAHVEVPHHDTLALGKGDFSIGAWVYTEKDTDDVLGDIVGKYDPSLRKGLTLNLKASSGGYQSSGDDRHVYFGIDNGRLSEWQYCGKPGETSNYVSNSLTVYQGNLYAAIVDAREEKDWCHVYRYESPDQWIDCGRVGTGRTTGVIPMIVHQGDLYAATTTYDWSRVHSGGYDLGRVYRYQGGTQWEDCGQPGTCLRINCMASYRGKLYAGGDRGNLLPGERTWSGRPYKVYVYEGGTDWQVSGEFTPDREKSLYAHAMAVHDGKLYAGYPTVYAFDGDQWEYAGTPLGDTPAELLPVLQVHSLEVYQGKLHAGMWPEARAVVYQGGTDWEDDGQLGDGTEINAFTVYNGKLYGGTLPRAEVMRYDGDGSWTSLHRFYSPEGWTPAPAMNASAEQLKDWTRLTSLTVYRGRLFASTGSCTSSVLDAPVERGKVFSMEAGKCVSYDDDIGPGWNHLVAMREKGRLTIHVNGKLVSESSKFRPDDYDISNDKPLKIGFGEMDYFSGRIREVCIYNRALGEAEIQRLTVTDPPVSAAP